MDFGASVIAIVTAGIAVGKRVNVVVKTLKHAPQELLALTNELSDLNLVLDTAKEALGGNDVSISVAERTAAIVSRTESAFAELDELLMQITNVLSSQSSARGRVLWLKEKRKVVALHERIKSIRGDVVSLVSIRTLALTQTTSIDINDLKRLVAVALDQHPPIKAALPVAIKHADNGTSQLSAAEEGISRAIQLPLTSTTYTGVCSTSCSCTCHRKYNVRIANMLLGVLFIGYHGSPIASVTCNERSCVRQTVPSIQLAYFFPQWFISYAIYMFLTASFASESPQVTLSVARVIPATARSFEHVWVGDLDAVKVLFNSRIATPMDVDDMDGGSYLNYALRSRKHEMARFIFELPGTKASLEDQFGESPVDVAWQLVLSRKVEPSFEAWLRARVAEADRLRSRKFSTLHKIICGLCSHDLESELLNSTTSIDEVDAGGWTPLVWAAYCQDWYAIDLLLKFGADATIANKKGQLALHQACREGLGDVVSDECLATITRLAAATTNLNKKDVYGDTPLMYAAEHDGDPRVLRTLHKAGASLHEVDLTGHTVLHIAIYFDNARAIETLVDLGAYIDQLSSGHTPLMKTFICNAHESMKLLFRLGADVTLPEPDGGTLLHVAAINADAASFDILASEVAVKILDPNSPNREGHTASQLFREKRLVKAEKDTVETWDSLIDELRVEMLMRSASSLQMRNSWNSAEEGLASPTSSGADTDLYFDAEHELTDNDEKKLLSDGS